MLHFGLKGAGPGHWFSGEGQDFRGSSGEALAPHTTCQGEDLRWVSVPNKQIGPPPGCPASLASPLASQGLCFSCFCNKEVICRSPGVYLRIRSYLAYLSLYPTGLSCWLNSKVSSNLGLNFYTFSGCGRNCSWPSNCILLKRGSTRVQVEPHVGTSRTDCERL